MIVTFFRALTVVAARRGDGVELAHGRDQADRSLHAIVRVVPRGAGDQVADRRFQAKLVEQARDAGGGHAAPVIVVACEHARENRDLCVSWGRIPRDEGGREAGAAGGGGVTCVMTLELYL